MHRPTGFGKTTFLKELGQFCDISQNDSKETFKYFLPGNTTNSYVARHRAKHLVLHFDFNNLLDPAALDSFTDAGFREQLNTEIRAALERYVVKYSSAGLFGVLSIGDPSELSLIEMCQYLPVRCCCHATLRGICS